MSIVARRTHLVAVWLTLAFAATLSLIPLFASSAPPIKRSKSDRDINAIGQREIIHEQVRKFIGSPEKEKERGAAWAAAVEHSTKLIHDPALTGYLAALAQNLARNSDAQLPITVTLIDSDEVNACTSPGGYQYLTRGLLLQLESEGELAAVLAHGIAHAALHSPTIQAWRQVLMQVSSVGPAQNSAFNWFTCTSPVFRIADGRRQADEYDADYFGVQYVYKTGYDPDSYVRFVQRTCTAPLSANGNDVLAFLHFPRPSERVKALRGEISDILPQRGEATVSTSAFEEFKEHLHTWQTQHPETKQPVLRRANTDE
jgi:predicted Zn-dependent protease